MTTIACETLETVLGRRQFINIGSFAKHKRLPKTHRASSSALHLSYEKESLQDEYSRENNTILAPPPPESIVFEALCIIDLDHHATIGAVQDSIQDDRRWSRDASPRRFA
jgi:hypothetical protein